MIYISCCQRVSQYKLQELCVYMRFSIQIFINLTTFSQLHTLCTLKRTMNTNDEVKGFRNKVDSFLRYYPNILREEQMITTKILWRICSMPELWS
jgi:hypothetical protein